MSVRVERGIASVFCNDPHGRSCVGHYSVPAQGGPPLGAYIGAMGLVV